MKRFANVVNTFGASILDSARALLPLFLIVLLGWFLIETVMALYASPLYHLLSFLLALALVVVAVIAIFSLASQWGDVSARGRPANPSTALSFVFCNVGLIIVVMCLGELFTPRLNFATPLLNFYQLLFRKITG